MQGTIKSFKQDSQNAKILEYLKSGASLTCLQAQQFGFGMNLRSRISDLKRAGYDVQSKQVNIDNGSYIAEYRLNYEYKGFKIIGDATMAENEIRLEVQNGRA
jgi:hypothetical protein